jgi:hypothetical protein
VFNAGEGRGLRSRRSARALRVTGRSRFGWSGVGSVAAVFLEHLVPSAQNLDLDKARAEFSSFYGWEPQNLE